MPARIRNEKGEIRKIGFEMEFSGLELPVVASVVADIFGGTIRKESRFSYSVVNTNYGDFTVELDAAILKDQRYKEYLKKIGLDIDRLEIGADIEDVLSLMAGAVVPHEIVLPPIPMDKIQIVEELRERLRKKEAKGTKASFIYAFSLQINPEVPSLKSDSLLNYLKSFLLLYNWIFKESKIDLARRMAPFINEFPLAYATRVLSPGYKPDLTRLIEDYLYDNPTRNRPLDMLPLFSYLDKDLVMSSNVEKELIKPRPTFHYRLPNCLIDEPDWRVAREWNFWAEVENLANDPEKIRRMATEFLKTVNFPFGVLTYKWVQKVPYWIGCK